MHFPKLKRPTILHPIVPLELGIRIMHQPIHKFPTIRPMLCCQRISHLVSVLKLPIVDSLGPLLDQPPHCELPHYKLTIVNSAIAERVLSLTMSQAVFKLSLISAFVFVIFDTPPLRFVIHPVSLIFCLILSILEIAFSTKAVVFETPSIKRTICVDQYPFYAVGQSSLEAAFVVYPIFSVYFPVARRTAFEPLALVVAARHGGQNAAG